MLDKECLKYMNTKCDKDAKGRHFWERRGIANFPDLPAMCIIWQCTQCNLCAEENLEFVQPDVLCTKDEEVKE